MCGLAGVILGKKRRRAEEREHLAWLFTQLLVLRESWGHNATGVAWLNRDGEHRLFKRPVSVGQFVIGKTFHEDLAGIDNRTTGLLGHTRWRTRGDEHISRTNYPIRAGDIIGTHNAPYTTPIICSAVSNCRGSPRWTASCFSGWRTVPSGTKRRASSASKATLPFCRGQITAVLASRRQAGTVLVLKGSKPLELRIHRRRAALYASDPAFLDAVLAEERRWRPLPLEP